MTLPSPSRSIAALVLLSPLATALWATKGDVDSNRQADIFLKAYTGLGLTDNSELQISQPSLGNDVKIQDVAWDDHSLSSPSIPYIGVRLGYFLKRRPWFGLSIDVFHFKVFADSDREVHVVGQWQGQPIEDEIPMGQIVERYEIANGVNMILFNAIGRYVPRHEDGRRNRFTAYSGIGLGPTVLYTVSQIGEFGRGGYELGNLGTQIFVGLDFKTTKKIDLFIEVKKSHTNANGSVLHGDSKTTLDSRHFVFGAGYHF